MQILSGVNSVQQLRLRYGAQQLQDNKTIGFYGITSGSVVELTRKLIFTFQRIYLLPGDHNPEGVYLYRSQNR